MGLTSISDNGRFCGAMIAMPVSIVSLYGSALLCDDQVIGNVRDFLFDDETWVVRYLVVETGAWPCPQRIVISPADLEDVDIGRRQVSTRLTPSEIQANDLACSHPPVSQQEAIRLAGPPAIPLHWANDNPVEVTAENDPHLRSTHEITGYVAKADARRVGHIQGFMVSIPEQLGQWRIEAILIRMGHSPLGKRRAVPTSEVREICWRTRTLLIEELSQSKPPHDKIRPPVCFCALA